MGYYYLVRFYFCNDIVRGWGCAWGRYILRSNRSIFGSLGRLLDLGGKRLTGPQNGICLIMPLVLERDKLQGLSICREGIGNRAGGISLITGRGIILRIIFCLSGISFPGRRRKPIKTSSVLICFGPYQLKNGNWSMGRLRK